MVRRFRFNSACTTTLRACAACSAWSACQNQTSDLKKLTVSCLQSEVESTLQRINLHKVRVYTATVLLISARSGRFHIVDSSRRGCTRLSS